jgi:7-carboxy-7-deazaguanine synthase
VITYQCNDIYSTIQGEGCLAGTAMVLVRLQGCGVGCPWCDTKETWVADPADRAGSIGEALGTSPRWAGSTADEVAGLVAECHPGPRWVLLTGGEPAEQPLGPMADALHARGYRVALETSGTAAGHLGVALDWVCVSPKVGMPGGKSVLPEVLATADEVKMVIGTPDDLAVLDLLLASAPLKPGAQVCLQPVGLSRKATALCAAEAIRRGCRLSLQLHKMIDLR